MQRFFLGSLCYWDQMVVPLLTLCWDLAQPIFTCIRSIHPSALFMSLSHCEYGYVSVQPSISTLLYNLIPAVNKIVVLLFVIE